MATRVSAREFFSTVGKSSNHVGRLAHHFCDARIYVRIHSFPSPGCSISSSSFSARGHEPRNNPARRGVAFRNCREKFTEKLRRDSYTWGSRCADLRRSQSYRRKESSGSNYNRAITRDIFPRESGQIIPH